jgi:hypothetical protein
VTGTKPLQVQTVLRQKPLEFTAEADAVLIGSGIMTRDVAADADLLTRIRLDPARQLIGAQCSGTLLLAKLGLIGDLPACTDLTTKPWVIEAGVKVIDAPFVAHGNVATAGGCLASQYLASWMIARGASLRDAEEAMHYVAPVGEKALYVDQAMRVVTPLHRPGNRFHSLIPHRLPAILAPASDRATFALSSAPLLAFDSRLSSLGKLRLRAGGRQTASALDRRLRRRVARMGIWAGESYRRRVIRRDNQTSAASSAPVHPNIRRGHRHAEPGLYRRARAAVRSHPGSIRPFRSATWPPSP